MQGILPSHVVPAWEQDGWNAAVIVSAGRAFNFLAWYRPLTLPLPLSEKPDLTQLRSASPWLLRGAGTAKAIDLKRLGFENIGRIPVNGEKLKLFFPPCVPGCVPRSPIDGSGAN
jgi:hypothetical protein